MRLTALIPLIFAIIAFVVGILCLLAGYKTDFMQNYDIIALNTSGLGQNIFDTTSSSTAPSSTASSVSSLLENLGEDVVETIENKVGDAANNVLGHIADRLATELGIQEWYNLHLMTMCEGNYQPNATADGAERNVTECTKAKGMFQFNITARLERQLSIGPLDLSLEDIGYPTERIDKGIRDLNLALDAMFILYAIGVAFSGLLILTSAASFFTAGSRVLAFVNVAIASIGFMGYLIGSVIITILQKKAVQSINKYGNPVGLYARKGGKFLALTWVATAMLVAAMVAWTVDLCRARRTRGMGPKA